MPLNGNLESIRQSDGKLPAFAWPGGYPIIYLTEDGDVLCPECANIDSADLKYYNVYLEGPIEYCYDCGKEIEGAYGDVGGEP
jgi:hypothetical protein